MNWASKKNQGRRTQPADKPVPNALGALLLDSKDPAQFQSIVFGYKYQNYGAEKVSTYNGTGFGFLDEISERRMRPIEQLYATTPYIEYKPSKTDVMHPENQNLTITELMNREFGSRDGIKKSRMENASRLSFPVEWEAVNTEEKAASVANAINSFLQSKGLILLPVDAAEVFKWAEEFRESSYGSEERLTKLETLVAMLRDPIYGNETAKAVDAVLGGDIVQHYTDVVHTSQDGTLKVLTDYLQHKINEKYPDKDDKVGALIEAMQPQLSHDNMLKKRDVERTIIPVYLDPDQKISEFGPNGQKLADAIKELAGAVQKVKNRGVKPEGV